MEIGNKDTQYNVSKKNHATITQSSRTASVTGELQSQVPVM